jgi:AmiR/NasT family two-component response regulator
MTTATLPANGQPSTPPVPSLRIAVADDERDMRQFFEELLTHLGHKVVAVAETGRQLVELCRANPPDLVVTDIRMPDMDGLQAVAELNRDRPVPVLLVSGYHDSELLAQATAEYVMGYLVKPVKPVDVQAAVVMAASRFEHLQRARLDAEGLRKQLEERKLIEQAKGSVMRRLRVDEMEAYRFLREYSSNHNWKLVETARKVMEAEALFRGLEEVGKRH